jgi:hypothetical protein
LVFTTLLATAAAGQEAAGRQPPGIPLTASLTPSATVTPTITPTPAAVLFMPFIHVVKTPEVELLDAWSSDAAGGKLQAFMPAAPILYHAGGMNNLTNPAEIALRWQQYGACASGQVFSDTVTIPAGDWDHANPGTAPTCTGVFSATANLKYDYIDTSETTYFVVNRPGTVQISVQQGFDKCYAPSLSDMQTWWEESPYVIYNIYLGGISFACKNDPLLNAVWVRQAAQQGWGFLLTWVGPQAPCTSFKYKMSSDADEAYDEGKAEAIAAVNKAESLGFFGQKVIYYDLEAFPNASNSCKRAARAFIRGWAEQLNALGQRSGAYGSPCSSYISEWATNAPPPDNIWMAHWYTDFYDPDAQVYDTPCLDDGLWSHHQRVKQYAGGHSETWGGEKLTIDSNVFDGEINLLEGIAGSAGVSTTLKTIGAPLLDMGMLSSQVGWALSAGSLWGTEDGGATWKAITPLELAGGRLAAAYFSDAATGWAVGYAPGDTSLRLAQTSDGGASWNTELLDVPADGAASAQIRASGGQLYLALELASSSSFSLGRLFTSPDGGATWVERSLPAGGRVEFEDALNGWMVGGAAGDELWRTQDGGETWAADASRVGDAQPEAGQGAALLPEEAVLVRWSDDLHGWAITSSGDCAGEKEAGGRLECVQVWKLLATEDGGAQWREITPCLAKLDC